MRKCLVYVEVLALIQTVVSVRGSQKLSFLEDVRDVGVGPVALIISSLAAMASGLVTRLVWHL